MLCLAAACGRSHDAPSAAPAGSWSLAPQPLLFIGREGAPGHELDRVFGGAVISGGRVVIGNSGTGELRFFDSAGRLSLTAGRKGRGPGEFQGISWVRPFRGDSLLAFDLHSQKFSVWSQAGQFGRAFQLDAGESSARPVGVFPDGSILLAAETQSDPRREPGARREQIQALRLNPAGGPARPVGTFPGAEWLLYQHPQSFAATQIPFGKSGFLAVAGGYVVYASSESPRISVIDSAGTVVRTLEVPFPRRRLGTNEVDAALAEIPDEAERAALRRHLQPLLGAADAPLIQDLRVDASGNLWVRGMADGRGQAPWRVLDLSGKEVGSVLMPAGYMPLDIRPGQVLLSETDEDGVQRVSLREVTQ